MRKRLLSLILVLCTVFTMLPFGAMADKGNASFSDVVQGAFYAKPVKWAVDEGITKGISPTVFGPNDPCTRGQVVTFLWRAEGCPAPANEKNPFDDVKNEGNTKPYYEAILWASQQEITKGYDASHFRPGNTVTRAQFVTFLWRAAGMPNSSKSQSFSDVPGSAYYAKAVAWAVENGITKGYTKTSFAPNQSCTRGQVVTFLYRWKVGELDDAPCVCIDAGHQSRQNSGVEPMGPGSSQMKMKCSSGTQGRWTRIEEYELDLAVSLKLRDILEARGYRVVMTRTTNDVDLSNIDRAKIAENAGADILVRIHANGADSSSANGAMTICMTKNNPYNAYLYNRSYALSKCILDDLVSNTGCRREYIWETDTMCGINWATMPVTIVEMGYMTNQREDTLLATDAYREKVAIGIANGIDDYFANNPV